MESRCDCLGESAVEWILALGACPRTCFFSPQFVPFYRNILHESNLRAFALVRGWVIIFWCDMEFNDGCDGFRAVCLDGNTEVTPSGQETGTVMVRRHGCPPSTIFIQINSAGIADRISLNPPAEHRRIRSIAHIIQFAFRIV